MPLLVGGRPPNRQPLFPSLRAGKRLYALRRDCIRSPCIIGSTRKFELANGHPAIRHRPVSFCNDLYRCFRLVWIKSIIVTWPFPNSPLPTPSIDFHEYVRFSIAAHCHTNCQPPLVALGRTHRGVAFASLDSVRRRFIHDE